jgi:hypothetical protein
MLLRQCLRLELFRAARGSGGSPLAFINAGIHPIMPQKGSVGASGDLAPLAYLAAAIAGFDEAEVMYQGQRMRATQAIELAGIGPVKFDLKAKDASASSMAAPPRWPWPSWLRTMPATC